ncbi:MAG: hypothetical protein GTN89_03675, partial [Acidobacteria bacterium]|nr:hypothetical protein [Acidobacteriota bacterium]NIM63485.1 hypothetical protein [Acidobacteriota bacterium]NIO58423.1 hypothetical protein [Acidobacteriota bacterium]NIQ29478.1 hypothetical protein [Acidobacteriota bacterium]NIQ84137.1 hypothetical protein [Acidobacteriota bacterium]
HPVIRAFSLSADGSIAAFSGESPTHPLELFVLEHGDERPRRMTDHNPWLAGVDLAKQEVVSFEARDGLQLEGVLVHPLNGERNAPLIL